MIGRELRSEKGRDKVKERGGVDEDIRHRRLPDP